MNISKYLTTFIFSAVTISAASSALADDKWIGEEGTNWREHVTASKSSATREQVEQATIAAARRGEVRNGDELMYPQTVSGAVRTRAEVHADAVRASRSVRGDRGVYTGG
jgi:hypothetical protein